MSDISGELHDIDERTMKGLKDFQRATVMRVDQLFREGQKRVLVADEVGLGKTLIAKGVIAKMAILRYEEHDELFKVVYICSNQNIARQNIRKLNIFRSGKESIATSRLSMQHLTTVEQELAAKKEGNYVELIPLTPTTSFSFSKGSGNIEERALIFAILCRIPIIYNNPSYKDKLEFILKNGVKEESWNRYLQGEYSYPMRIAKCHKESGGVYPNTLLSKVRESDTFKWVLNYLKHREDVRKQVDGDGKVISDLRYIFAKISVDSLNPDLVIMDEFQRFKFLIDDNSADTETKLLTDKFLTGKSDDIQDVVRVLLLSATPYKLYSTPEEIYESGEDAHYHEFMGVMNFLMNDQSRFQDFKTVWSDYSHSLSELSHSDLSLLSVRKQAAENLMYSYLCRTERNSVMENGDFIDDKSKQEALSVSEGDILSYIDVQRIIEETGINISLPIDYFKSSPYILSFMQNYEAKKKLTEYFKLNIRRGDIYVAKSKWLWLDKSAINNYRPLPDNINARFKRLKYEAVDSKSALMMWVPPVRPYYPLQGVYKDAQSFSKLLVFSSWEMVPKMIAGLISYEAERLSVGHSRIRERQKGKKSVEYFSEKRYPQPRMTFKLASGEPATMTLLSLIYPNKTLAGLYNPIDCLNRGITSLREVEQEILAKVRLLLKPYRICNDKKGGATDKRWYYLVPMLFDGVERVVEWIDKTKSADEKYVKAIDAHLSLLRNFIENPPELGREPIDLEETIVDMVLGSPAICSLRAYDGDVYKASELAQILMRRFNSVEATAIVELAYSRRRDDDAHWQDLLRYCKDGNFQAVLDEYFHLIKEGEPIDDAKHEYICNALTLRTASIDAEDFIEFRNRIYYNHIGREKKLRSNYAVCFGQAKSDVEGSVNRKDSIQASFNSPMRPFVLATTSIGQEGLDFHFYCRKIMHWNLPQNPVDLEQREGRINRFKCLAIRENIARKYSNIKFKEDIWQEMFQAAENERGSNQSELIPYWCFGKNQQVKIERLLPFYPMSKDGANYARLIKILSYYRLSLGQPRQEELLEYIFSEIRDDAELKKLFIDLSPYSRSKKRSL